MENKTNINLQSETKNISIISQYIQNLKNFINNTFLGSDIGLLLTIIIVFIIISFGGILAFENIGLIRYNFVNNSIGIIGALVFIYIIFKFTGFKVKIINANVDLGYILYVLIILGLFIIFSG
jgi:hypothetical protein